MLIESPDLADGYQVINLENMHSGMSCGVLTVDADGKIIALTSEARRLLNLPGSKEPLLLKDLPAPLQSIVQEVLRTGQTTADRRIALPQVHDGQSTIIVNVTPSSLAKPAAVVVILKSDLSLAKLEYNLRRLDRLASIGT